MAEPQKPVDKTPEFFSSTEQRYGELMSEVKNYLDEEVNSPRSALEEVEPSVTGRTNRTNEDDDTNRIDTVSKMLSVYKASYVGASLRKLVAECIDSVNENLAKYERQQTQPSVMFPRLFGKSNQVHPAGKKAISVEKAQELKIARGMLERVKEYISRQRNMNKMLKGSMNVVREPAEKVRNISVDIHGLPAFKIDEVISLLIALKGFKKGEKLSSLWNCGDDAIIKDKKIIAILQDANDRIANFDALLLTHMAAATTRIELVVQGTVAKAYRQLNDADSRKVEESDKYTQKYGLLSGLLSVLPKAEYKKFVSNLQDELAKTEEPEAPKKSHRRGLARG